MKQALRIASCLFLLLVAAPSLMWGQSTGTITGQVLDQTGAVVPGAQVTLTSVATKSFQGQPTNSVGRFLFVDVQPGTYDLTVTAKGFRKLTLPAQEVVVGAALTLNLTLEVGTATQTVEVKSVAGAELQTLNSTMGSTMASDTIIALPNANRDATSLIMFQPNVAPTFGGTEGNTTGGQVAGAMSDQSTFRLDGGNATSDMEGDNNYVATNRQYVGPQAAIPTPIESIQEFKIDTNNMTADFSGSSGGQIVMLTKRGQDAWHGSMYEYYQSQLLNAAGWTNDINHTPKVKYHQNRFGGAIGGPMTPNFWGGKTYFYLNYEGRRFPNQGVGEWLVPSATMRNGVLEFYDNASTPNLISYNLKTSTQCGLTGGLPCDPRGVGINPVVTALWSKYLPLPNDCPNYGDHINACGFRGPYSLAVAEDNGIARFDHDFGAKWHAYATYRYYREANPTTQQIDIGGLIPGDTLGVPASGSSTPLQPRYGTLSLTGTLKPTVTNQFSVSYLRNDWQWQRAGVLDANSSIAAGLEFGESHNYVPMNMDTQNSRYRIWDGHDWNFADNLSWLRGNHLLQFGGSDYHEWMHHARNDAVVSGLTSLMYQMTAGTGLVMTAPYQPLPCSSTATPPVTTGCLPSGKKTGTYGWNTLYPQMLGIVGTASQLFVRGGSNFALTGAPSLQDTVKVPNYSLYFNDSWKIRPNITINYGLEWGVQMPPYEINGVQDYFTDASGGLLTAQQYISNKMNAALQGQNYNPQLGFEPIRGVGGSPKYPFAPYYGGFSPRVSLAYSPTWDQGFIGKLFGHKTTVIRGGYARIYDRSNGVNLVLTPLLGYGFAQPINCSGAGLNGLCNGSKTVDPTGNTTTAATGLIGAFRIGVDGNKAPFPTVTQTLPVPVVPGINSPAGVNLSFLDRNWRPGSNDQIDFSLQRQLKDNIIIEAGYAGRWAKNLYTGRDLNDVPWMMTLGGQSFANAYDNLYFADSAGKKAAVQPFFESALGPTSAYCSGYTSCTAAVQHNEGSSGTGNIDGQIVYSMWADMDRSFTFGPALPATVQGMNSIQGDDTAGWSNYQAFTFTVQKRTGHDLMVVGNFTYSKSLNTIGINQEYTAANPEDPFNLRTDYGPSPWDRRLVMNILSTYGLPFGKGKTFDTHNGVLNRIVGGWTIAPIFTWATGTPIETYTDGSYGQEWGNGNNPWYAGAVPLKNISGTYGNTYHRAVNTSTMCSAGIGSNNDPACGGGGTGGNLFADPIAVYNSYRPDLVGYDGRSYDYGPLHGQHRWNLDMTLAKTTMVYKERVGVTAYCQAFNVLNHMMYSDPYMDLQDPADWGTLTGQYGGARNIELGLRVAW